MNRARCSVCQADVYLVPTTSCSKLKLDVEPIDDGEYNLAGGSIVQVGAIAGIQIAVRIGASQLDAARRDGIPIYRLHSITCSKTPTAASEWDARRARVGRLGHLGRETEPSDAS